MEIKNFLESARNSELSDDFMLTWMERNHDVETAEMSEFYPQFWLEACQFPSWPIEPEIFLSCVNRVPGVALHFQNIYNMLSPEQRNGCIKAAPSFALLTKHVYDRLTKKQFDRCVKAAPDTALELEYVCDRLTKEQFAKCIKDESEVALCSPAFNRLTAEQIKFCEEKNINRSVESDRSLKRRLKDLEGKIITKEKLKEMASENEQKNMNKKEMLDLINQKRKVSLDKKADKFSLLTMEMERRKVNRLKANNQRRRNKDSWRQSYYNKSE